MNILVVGGTGFLGGAIVNTAVLAGHDVTILSRGISAMPHASKIKRLTCDRHQNLCSLYRRQFDAVFDTCAYAPGAVTRLLDALDLSSLNRYIFISSASVYGDYSRSGLSERVPVHSATDEHLALAARLPARDRSSAAAYGSAYGPLKRDCECVALERLGDRALILRSGLLVGAGDYTDRLTWWVRRIDQGGSIAVPGPPDRPIQLIDVCDAAAFALLGVTKELSGIYNLTSRPISMQTLLSTISCVAESVARFSWIDEKLFLSSGLKPWTEVPLWLPAIDKTLRHFFEINVEKAYDDGLCIRLLDDTLANILKWDRAHRSRSLKCGIPPAKESILLDISS